MVNVFSSGELDEKSNLQKIQIANSDKPVAFYSLDAILWFMQNNGILYRPDGTKRIADGTLVALTLMIAESRMDEMDILVKAVRLIRIYQIPGMILFFTFSLYSL